MKLLIMIFMVVYTPDNVPVENVGTYPIEVSQGEDNSAIINWTIIDDTTVKYENIYFDAKDIYITDENSLSSDFIITNSNAYVWNSETLEEYEVLNVKYYKISENEYEAELFTINGFSNKVMIYVVSKEEYLEKNGIYTYVDQESAYNSDTILTRINFMSFLAFFSINAAITILIITMTKYHREFSKNIETYLRAKGINKK